MIAEIVVWVVDYCGGEDYVELQGSSERGSRECCSQVATRHVI